MMKTVVGVRFKKAGKIYYFDSIGLPIHQYDHVVVETAQGIEYGEVALAPREIDDEGMKTAIKPVLRLATAEDEKDYADLRTKERDARKVFEKKVREHHLDMKLINVEYTFDKKKAIFYFTADGRVDFRNLVKDLASIFRLRIELRQIGVRDEAKIFNTLGVCGRNTCCSQWLGDFTPVSIKMAKEQGLSLNSTKISGICGRLLCCLTYEDDFYHKITKKMPKIGNWVTTPDGEGQVYRLSVLDEKVLVRVQLPGDETEIRPYDVDQVVKSGDKHVQANNKRQQMKKMEQEKKADGPDAAPAAAPSPDSRPEGPAREGSQGAPGKGGDNGRGGNAGSNNGGRSRRNNRRRNPGGGDANGGGRRDNNNRNSGGNNSGSSGNNGGGSGSGGSSGGNAPRDRGWDNRKNSSAGGQGGESGEGKRKNRRKRRRNNGGKSAPRGNDTVKTAEKSDNLKKSK